MHRGLPKAEKRCPGLLAKVALVAGLCALPVRAQASLIELWGEAGYGTVQQGGSFADSNIKPDFYKVNGGGATGFGAGVHVLFVDGYVTYNNLFGDYGTGSLTKFGVGFGPNIDVGPIKVFFTVGGGIGYMTWDDKAKALLPVNPMMMGAAGGASTPELGSTMYFGEARFGGEYRIPIIPAFGLGVGAWGNIGAYYQPSEVEFDTSLTSGAGTDPNKRVKFEPVAGWNWALIFGVRGHVGL